MQSEFKSKSSDTPPSAYLVAGPTASGKSALALQLAQRVNGAIINADALQVYAQWQILTARPDQTDLRIAPHYLYGHVQLLSDYSVGHWLRDVTGLLPKLHAAKQIPIFVGGTGLYFDALLNGLANIPPITNAVKTKADTLQRKEGKTVFDIELARLDPKTHAQIDTKNPARTRRAWEVLISTGQGLADWQAQTGPALLTRAQCSLIALNSDPAWLNARIDQRFDKMLEQGAIEECKAVLDQGLWRGDHPSCRAIGAAELIAYLQGKISLDSAKTAASQTTRRYAKRQRTWLRNRMGDWPKIQIDHPDDMALWMASIQKSKN